MKVLVLHLSDMHVTSKKDALLDRAPTIRAAVRDLDHEIEAVLGIVSGDLTDSGNEDQCIAALGFLDELGEKLEDSLSLMRAPDWFLVPGNHDCNFDLPHEARELILENVKRNPERAATESVIESLTSVQEPFFDTLPLLPRANPAGRSLYATQEYEYGPQLVRVHGLNTACTSRLRETQGELVFPPSVIPDPEPTQSINIAVLHHPYKWLSADNSRRVRDRVEGLADIVLTGHEHDPATRKVEPEGKEVSHYFEGGVLQDTRAPNNSSFNVIVLDLERSKQKYYRFAWEDSLYALQTPRKPAWEDLQVGRLLAAGGFRNRANIEDWCKDPGLTLTHPNTETVSFDDIYIYPELELTDVAEDTSVIIRSEDVYGNIASEGISLITGAENTGKSALAKALYRDLRKDGRVPVYLTPQDIRGSRPEDVRESLLQAFQEQYASPGTERFRQIDPDKRATIVDDFHELITSLKAPESTIEFLRTFSGTTVLIASEIKYDLGRLLSGLKETETGESLTRYRIEEFGHLLRKRLIEKWHSLGTDAYEADEQFAQRLQQTEQRVQALLGSNLIPSYPVFILSILQSTETAARANLEAGHYGAFYELFIQNALADLSSIQALDVKRAYLAHVGYAMYERDQHTLSEDDFITVHSEYKDKYDVRLNFSNILSELQASGILREQAEGSYAFKYRYAYYYFVASYMKRHLHEEAIRDEIRALVRTLHVEDHGNIVLFLTHLSKDPFILDELLSAAEGIFPDSPAVTLDEGLPFLEGLDEQVRDIVYVEVDPDEAREERLRARDDLEREKRFGGEDGSRRASAADQLEPINKLNSAFKTVQILGQVLKNFPGSIQKERKKELLSACYDVGRRSIGAIFSLIEDHRDEIVSDVVDVIEERHPGFGPERIRRRAKKTIFGFTRFISFAFIKNISRSVGSRALEETYPRLIESEENAIVRLIDCCIQLDHFDEFPEEKVLGLKEDYGDGNVLTGALLRGMVVDHFYLFPRERTLRQRICNKLDIPFQGKLQAPDRSRLKRERE